MIHGLRQEEALEKTHTPFSFYSNHANNKLDEKLEVDFEVTLSS